ncbi:hypothetical protein COHA_007792 [Chlorella ohadii]|uniref:BZIP domain-containing protein n=1 Tax=Chlorella ohadii TaxID=2649997 RepID=A0AAD5DI43_9CHLO|nr:hypothetical protein COHA_007792 [Chlorella ohadii]
MWGAPAPGDALAAAPGPFGAQPDQGGLAWMLNSGGLLHSDQPAGGQPQQPAADRLLPSLQTSPTPALGLDGLPQLDGGLLDLLPPLPLVPSTSSGAAASGAATTSTAELVDKRAVPREKNRIAQQRFREKERAKLAEAEEEAEALGRQLSQLRLENERLQLEHTLLQKLLVVRNAIASVVVQLDSLPGLPQIAEQQQQQQTQTQTQQAQTQQQQTRQWRRRQQQAAPPVEQQAQQAAQQKRGGDGGGSGGGVPAAELSATALLQDPAALQAASQQLAAALGELPSLDQVEELAVEGVESVQTLLAEWQQWRLGLRQRFKEAEARRFADQEQVDALAAHMDSFIQVFWAACHVRPQLFNQFLVSTLPPPSMDWSGEWARVAYESLPLLTDSDVAVFRQAMQRYTKRVAIAAVGVRPWVQRLQAVVAAQRSMGSMHSMAAEHAQVTEVAARLHHACTEHYLAYMGLLSDVSARASVVLRALWHSSSDPFAPDHPAIIHQILRLHQQQQRVQQQLTAAEPAAAAASGQQQQQQQQQQQE